MNGALRLKVFARDGKVVELSIDSPRVDPSAVFVGRTPEEAVVLAGRLFSLCPMAQSLATRAATGLPPAPGEGLALLCERLAEMLRASLLDWPEGAPSGAEISALREALALLRRIPGEAGAAAGLRQALAPLGLGETEGFFARQEQAATEDEAAMNLRPRNADFLTRDDDLMVIEALWADKNFSRKPALPGRRAETGIAARRALGAAGFSTRMRGREEEMSDTLARIEACAPESDLILRGKGFSAVESARGRLYHACKLDASGRIADYRIVAPTEWNFHPDGPFARLLLGAKIGEGDEAKRRVERLAFVFDPCIKAEAEIRETAHA